MVLCEKSFLPPDFLLPFIQAHNSLNKIQKPRIQRTSFVTSEIFLKQLLYKILNVPH